MKLVITICGTQSNFQLPIFKLKPLFRGSPETKSDVDVDVDTEVNVVVGRHVKNRSTFASVETTQTQAEIFPQKSLFILECIDNLYSH